ncbi:MAG TPA: M67 family metallopeptidase [Ktedonobacterales bacterium]|nr:M67 family metallopeptidase [Ktedonobacterales bacterium]
MIPADALKQIASHARATYPAECCGLILADTRGALTFRPIANIAGTAEARGTSTRSGRDGYVMDPKALLHAFEDIDRTGGRLWGIVHSHPEVGAYFSNEDVRMALDDQGGPLYPGVHYLVVSVRSGRVDGARLYSWDHARKDFSEQEVTGIANLS